MAKKIITTTDNFSTDYWYSRAVENKMGKSPQELEKSITSFLKTEVPNFLTLIMERSCVLSCAHCLFQDQKHSSQAVSEEFNLSGVIENIVKQMPDRNDPPHYQDPMIIHEGRILKEWHLDVLKRLQEVRPDVKIGLIDNGSYVPLISAFQERGIKLDWLDISIDGSEKSHNLQRTSADQAAHQMAINGLKQARKIVQKEGRVSSLYTLTQLNYRDVEEASDLLFSPLPEDAASNSEGQERPGYIDEFHITTMSPIQSSNRRIEISTEEFQEAWEQIKRINAKHNSSDEDRVVFKLYYEQDLAKLAQAVGPARLWEALTSEETERLVNVQIGGITFYVDGVKVAYFPYSIWPQETFPIDVDGAFRVATCQQYTIEELRSGKAQDGSDISHYTNEQLTEDSSYQEAYPREVDNWWQNFGRYYLAKEIEVMQKIKQQAENH